MTVLAQSGESLFPSWKALLMAAADRLEKEKKVDDMTLVRSLVNIRQIVGGREGSSVRPRC